MAESDNQKISLKADALKKRLEELRESKQISNPDFIDETLKEINKILESSVENNLDETSKKLMGGLNAVEKKIDRPEEEPEEDSEEEPEEEEPEEEEPEEEEQEEEPEEESDEESEEKKDDKQKESKQDKKSKSLKDRLREAKERRERQIKARDKARKAKNEARDAKRLKRSAKKAKKDVARTAKKAKKSSKALKKGVQFVKQTVRVGKVLVKITVQTVQAVRGAAIFANPWFWLVVLIVLIIVVAIFVVIALFGGGVNKAADETGGSLFVPLRCERGYDKKLVNDVLYWTENPSGDGLAPRLGVTEALKKDLQWQGEDCGVDMTHKLDKRVLETLRYLVNDVDNDNGIPALEWSHIAVGMLTDGPHQTFRPLSKKERESYEVEEKIPMEANSAYRIGQAIGITSIGMTSAELTQALGLLEAIPVKVDWQKMIEMGTLYPAYEQMQLDASELFLVLERMVNTIEQTRVVLEAEETEIDEEALLEWVKDLYKKPQELIENLIENLNRVSSTDNPSMLDVTYEYLTIASGNFADALGDIEAAQADSLLAATIIGIEGIENPDADGVEVEDTKTYQKMREGIRFTFRAMQVANMDGWKGSTGEKLYLWQAYEARSNIRQLVLDLLRMPIVLKDKGETSGYGPVVKQLIVFSPEDDLDNGLPDVDVYPEGAIAVSDGGIAFAPRVPSEDYVPEVDVWDYHFSSLQVDNGVLFKACTDFIYDLKKLDEEGELNDTATLGTFRADEDMNKFCEILYGKSDYELEETEMAGKVTYQKFVHIGF